MTQQSPTYEKLPGKKKTFLMSAHRLWLGDDHLLHVHARAGVETYRRFYFSDIQALVTRKTVAGKVNNGILGLTTLILGLAAFSMGGGGAVFFYCAAGFFVFFLGANVLMGPTCRTHIKTAVKQNPLPSLHRLRAARKVMIRLRPLIRAVQGDLSQAQISRGPISERRPSPIPGAGRSLNIHGPAPASAARGNVHMIVAALLTATALMKLVEFVVNHMALTVIDLGLTFGLAIAAIVFLVQQYTPPRRNAMLAAAWTTAAYVLLTVIGRYLLYLKMAFSHPEVMTNQWEQLKLMTDTSPRDSTFLTGLQLFFVFFAGILAIIIVIVANSRNAAQPVAAGREGPQSPAGQSGGA